MADQHTMQDPQPHAERSQDWPGLCISAQATVDWAVSR